MCICWQLTSSTAKESSAAGLPQTGTGCATQGARAQAWWASPCGRGSRVPPRALHRRDWRLPFVQALHSLLGNLPSINTSPAPDLGESSSAGGRPLCLLLQPGRAMGRPQPLHWGWLRVLRQHVTCLNCFHFCCEPCSSPSASGSGCSAPSGTCRLLRDKQSERAKIHIYVYVI